MMSTPHTNRGTLCIASAGPRMRRMVVRTLIEPARLLSPDRWRLTMALRGRAFARPMDLGGSMPIGVVVSLEPAVIDTE